MAESGDARLVVGYALLYFGSDLRSISEIPSFCDDDDTGGLVLTSFVEQILAEFLYGSGNLGYQGRLGAVAMAVLSAMNPASLPITSTKNTRLWLSAVSLSLSMACTAVLMAVSKPIVKSVP